MYYIKKLIKKAIFSNIHIEHFYHYLALKIYQNKYKNYPFGLKNDNSKENYLELFNQASSLEYEQVLNYEVKTEFKLDKKWLNDLAMLTQVTIKHSDICYAHGRVLYSALRNYLKVNHNKYIHILETGTSKGFSSLCMAKALNDHSVDGSIKTIDIIPSDKEIYWNSISDFDGKKTRYKMLEKWSNLIDKYIVYIVGTSKNVLKYCNLERINFAFLDGSHTYYDVLTEFKFVAERQISGDMIIVDDYNQQYKGLIKAANILCKKFNYIRSVIKSNENRSYLICQKN